MNQSIYTFFAACIMIFAGVFVIGYYVHLSINEWKRRRGYLLYTSNHNDKKEGEQ